MWSVESKGENIMSKVSIIIPVYNEIKYIETCLRSILDSDLSKENTEIILVDGLSNDGTRETILSYVEQYDQFVLLDNSKRIAPVAMNIGIEYASGEYIFILSAHASYDTKYFTCLIDYINILDADCVGGVLYTEVKNKNTKSCAIKKILMHPFGVGNASFRLTNKKVKLVDTVAFGCYKKKVFSKYGLYNETLVRNQDIELNKRIVNGGGKIYLIPDVFCTYYARETFKALAKNNFANGKWNILTAYYTGTLYSLSLRHFIPLLFVLSLILPVIGAIFVPKLLWISLLSLVSYLTLVIIISLKLKKNDTQLHYLIIGFWVLHLSYGMGSLTGIFSVLKKYVKGKK